MTFSLESAEEAKAAVEAAAAKTRRLYSYVYYGVAAVAAIVGTLLWRNARQPEPQPPEVTVKVSAPVTAPTLHPAFEVEMAEPQKSTGPTIQIKPAASPRPAAAPAPQTKAPAARKQATTNKTVASASAEAKRVTTKRPVNPNATPPKPITTAKK